MFKIGRTPKQLSDDEKMLEIIKNCLAHCNPTYTDRQLKGLCRVSFTQTYGYQFTEIDTLWQKAKT
ncbi:MAG: hypothetical protein QG654_487 [Patescibacteria group bacterium]|nr:hypothetical protein [Patescibacteria group bacterium]